MATLTQIAKASGVSLGTVSTVLSHGAGNGSTTNVRISEATRLRILSTAESLGYRRNDLARAMATGKTQVIGVLAPTFESEMQMHILVGAQEVATNHGYLLKLLQVPTAVDEADKVRDVIAQCTQQRLSGVIAVSLMNSAVEILEREASTYHIPVALVDEAPEQKWAAHILSHDESGIREAIDHLTSLGHQNIALFEAQKESLVSQRRTKIFHQCLAEHALLAPSSHVLHGDWWEPEINEPIIREFLNTRTEVTAILCMSDWMGIAVQRAARSIGCSVPQDLSVIGFGDHTLAHFADPPLTSIHQPFQEMGRRAANALLSGDREVETTAYRVELPTFLKIRSSTGPAPTRRTSQSIIDNRISPH